MPMLHRIAQLADRVLPVGVADAHCDIPCGIYDPHDALQAAQTVIRMTELIGELEQKGDLTSVQSHNQMTRLVMVKEEHAEDAKRQTLILWTDYFKPPHLEKYPELHEKVWNAAKLASYTKQHVDMAKAQELKAAIQEIGDIFWETKNA
ncbi:MAG: superoxide dismutase, Ni [Dehalococcoidia bacterium]